MDPSVYVKTSYIIFEGKPLLQLVYNIWFNERPTENFLNLYGGHLDGLIWRVTLNEKGQPLIYDTIHDCGCYLAYFPTEQLVFQPKEKGFWNEKLFVPILAPTLEKGNRIHLRIESNTHYLVNVSTTSPKNISKQKNKLYAMQAYNQLRSIKKLNGYESLFNNKGMVTGTERNERFLFWPMGVPSAGQMRQWGHHATAFIGHRYFDGPLIISRNFEKSNH